ncbi:transcription factor atf1 [Fusarium tjaetaba]|uniref:Transcription factor atf1 n=1 Tax=Fusarium tjaetaba TaxID=1567544 RepID=A0A8H5QQM7_9HYPO|nr:transcription factor atf1 [Fusarium tjaetaba]KAF5621085.1 transcription factor atf1 [Fusarium tjaetaba]
MASLVDWGIVTYDEPHYGHSWGYMPDSLHLWNWQISSNTLYNIGELPKPFISPSSSNYCENDAITGRILSDEGLFNAPLAGSLLSAGGVGEEDSRLDSRAHQVCLYDEATLDIVQNHQGSLSATTECTPSSTPPESEPGLPARVKVSTSIQPRANSGTETEGKKRNRQKRSVKKNARKTKTGLNREEKRHYIKVLERNRRAAANCRARKQEQQDKLNAEVEKLQHRHRQLSASCNELRETTYQLKLQLLRHGDCGCTLIQRYIANEAVNSVESLISRHSPSSSPNSTTIGNFAASASACSPIGGLGGNNRLDKPHGMSP